MKSYIVAGLMFGDEGKGSIVDYLVRRFESKSVVRYSGGHQSAHNVITRDGKHHTFAQFGSGALAGARTVLDWDFIVSPSALLREREALVALGGNTEIWIHADCPVTTPLERAINIARCELEGKGGSCELGVGETRRSVTLGRALRVSDLRSKNTTLRKLRDLREAIDSELYYNRGSWQESLQKSGLRRNYLQALDRLGWSRISDDQYRSLSALTRDCFIFEEDEVAEQITPNSIFEGSQGFWLDSLWGIAPFTTWSNVTSRNAIERCSGLNLEFEVCGVARTYGTRHGNGPIPSEKERLTGIDVKNLLELEMHNSNHGPQGNFRVFHHDHGALKHAFEQNKCDFLAVNHCDVFPLNPSVFLEMPVKVLGLGPKAEDKVWRDQE